MNNFCKKCGSRLSDGRCPKCQPQKIAYRVVAQQPYPQQQYPKQSYPQSPQPKPPYPQPNIQNSPPKVAHPTPGVKPAQGPVKIARPPETKKQKKKREKQEKLLIKKNKKAAKRNNPKRKKIKKVIALALVATILFSSLWAFYAIFLKENLQILSSEGQFSTVTGKFTDIKIKNSDSAIEAAKEVSQSLGILQAADELTAKGESNFDGTNYYRLQQNYNGVPVYGRDIIVLASKSGTSQGAMSNLLDIPSDFEIDTSAEHKAISKSIRRYFSDSLKIKSDSVIIPDFTEDDLVIYSIDESKEIYSAYCLTVYADTDSYTVIVDSSDANILMAAPNQLNEKAQSKASSDLIFDQTMTLGFNEVQALCSEMNVKVFNAESGDITKYFEVTDTDGSLKYYNIDAQIWRNNSPASDAATVNGLYFTKASDDSALSEVNENMKSGRKARAKIVMSSIINTIDFYKTILGRNSFNNKNGYLPIVLDDNLGGDTDNAFSWGEKDITMIRIGSACNVSVDLVAHEFTHSVISSECNLAYRAESGAINEGLADIFGEFSEDWIDGVLDNKGCDWIHGSRNLVSPTSGNNPAAYKDDNWGSTWKSYDNGYVHKNSTVISHAAYLMSTGVDGTTPIPTETLSKLFYRAILTLPSNSNFSCFRQYIEDNAKLMKLSSDYKETIKAAFDRVGIENGATEIENYGKEFDLIVYDINAEEYSDYILEIEGNYRDSFGTLREYSKKNIECSSSPMTVSLENFGTYLLSVRDRNGSEKVYSKLITVSQIINKDTDFKETELKILTSFGDPFFDNGSDDEDSVRLKGQLRDTITNVGISGASVTLVMDEDGTSYSLTTDSKGYYQANVKPGLYYITCSANGYNETYSSALVEGNTTIRKPILLLWTNNRFISNPLNLWIPTLFDYISSLISRAIESIVWETMDSAISDVISDIPFLENLVDEYL